MARRKYYETSKIQQIKCATKRFDKLNNKPLKGSTETVRSELNKTHNLLHLIKVNISATERLFLISKLWSQIREIEENERQSRSFLQSIFQGSLSKNAITKIEQLNKKMPNGSTNSVFCANDYQNLKNYRIKLIAYKKLILRSITLAEERDKKRIESAIQRKEKDNKQREKRKLDKIRKKEKIDQIKAMAAAHAGKTRQLAQTIRRNIEHQQKILSFCPYCKLTLGNNPKADHIYPVAKGGLSTEKNMVFICAGCNSSKSDKTLRVFIQQKGLDWPLIEKNLELLGKDF
ncbi:MAG: HNH endonuclease [Methylococcales bacterium]